MNKRMMFLSFNLSLAILALTGCGRNLAGEDEIKDALNSNKSEEAQALYEQSPEQSQMGSRHLNYLIEGAKGSTLKVDADVNGIDSSKLAIYEIKKHGMDDEYIKGIADKVFDNNTYEYQKPSFVCSEEELDVVRNWIDSIADSYEMPYMCPKSINEEKVMWTLAKENFSSDNVQNIPEGQYYVSIPASNDNLNNIDVYDMSLSDISLCRFVGKIDGKDWVLSSMCMGNYGKAVLYPYFQNEAICTLEDKDANLNDICSIKKEDGEVTAKECLYKLGYQDYELIDITKTFFKKADDTATMNGYIYTYARSFNGIGTAYLARLNPEINTIDLITTPQEYVCIYVNSYGVEQIDFASNYELGEVLTKEPALLDFDKIDAVAQKRLKECMLTLDEANIANIDVNDIQLKYMAVADKNSKFSYVPVWVYHLKYLSYGSERCTTDLCINAIDGTIVNKIVNLGWADYMNTF